MRKYMGWKTLSDENKCGILISQYSGISNKNDFQIEFHNNNVIIFVHNSEYSNHKIEAAVNIIDHLFSSNGMIFNMKDVNKRKHYFYVNK